MVDWGEVRNVRHGGTKKQIKSIITERQSTRHTGIGLGGQIVIKAGQFFTGK